MAFEISQDDTQYEDTFIVYGRKLKVKTQFAALESKSFNAAYEKFALACEDKNTSMNVRLEAGAKVAEFFIPDEEDQEYIASLLRGTHPDGLILSFTQLMQLVGAFYTNMLGNISGEVGKAETGV